MLHYITLLVRASCISKNLFHTLLSLSLIHPHPHFCLFALPCRSLAISSHPFLLFALRIRSHLSPSLSFPFTNSHCPCLEDEMSFFFAMKFNTGTKYTEQEKHGRYITFNHLLSLHKKMIPFFLLSWRQNTQFSLILSFYSVHCSPMSIWKVKSSFFLSFTILFHSSSFVLEDQNQRKIIIKERSLSKDHDHIFSFFFHFLFDNFHSLEPKRSFLVCFLYLF